MPPRRGETSRLRERMHDTARAHDGQRLSGESAPADRSQKHSRSAQLRLAVDAHAGTGGRKKCKCSKERHRGAASYVVVGN
jgi:hypothetical protein